jgi:hypothetical protein
MFLGKNPIGNGIDAAMNIRKNAVKTDFAHLWVPPNQYI